jgi:23S rRNA pseudouridine1911/1915/1917 synthase
MNISLPNNLRIEEHHHGARLDIALVEILTISRSQAQTMIEEGRVVVNGKQPKKAGDRVKTGDTITFSEPIAVAETKAPFGIKKNTPARIAPVAKVKIIASTPDFIVVEKPSGMLTHPTEAGETNTLANFLTAQFPELAKVGDSPERPGIVHRLDKEASGLLVVARTQAMFEFLKDQFKNRTIGKHYTVLVHDPMPRVEGTIDFPIERSENAERMAAVPKTEKGLVTDKGKEALTDFLVIKNYVNFSLLDVTIHTGRMHQIRAHMFAYNHPVVGDPLYIQKKRARTWDERCGRLFLHCSQLSFKDLDGLPQEFESELPSELMQFLSQLV